MKKTEVIGNIGKAAELQTIGGKQYAKFSVAAESYKNRGGKDITEWIDCLKLDEQGKLTPYLKKGIPIHLEGKERINAYLKDGAAMANSTLWVNTLNFINYPKTDTQATTADRAVNTISDDDLPL